MKTLEETKIYNAKYYQEHEEKIKENVTNWVENNREKSNVIKYNYTKRYPDRRRALIKNKYDNDINFKLRNVLRARLRMALINNQKVGSAIADLGCSIPELKEHLEKQFHPGMSWENHSLKGWHIDHIIPLDSFDLEDRQQFLEANHYTNLQPLWWKDNLTKGNK